MKGLGGHIAVDSEVGSWSELIVDLPFLDNPVDIGAVSQSMSDTAVLLVHKPCDSDCAVNRVKQVMERYMVECDTFHSMDEMESAIAKKEYLSKHRAHICLVDTDLYNPEIFELLQNLSTAFLLSFGPNFAVEGSSGHFRCLGEVLPSVLVGTMSKCIKSGHRSQLVASSSLRSLEFASYEDLRVLVAEDNVINQKVLLRMLKKLGIENVTVVENGLLAVEEEASSQFDVCLMDMEMPVMDGIRACRKISNRRGGHPRPTIVFVTANASPSYEAECKKAGASGFLPKPFNFREIERLFQGISRPAGSVNEEEDFDPERRTKPLPVDPVLNRSYSSAA